MNEIQNDDGIEPPVLTEEGAALLARVVARHKTGSAGGHDRRRKRDPLRADPSSESAEDAESGPVEEEPAGPPAIQPRPDQDSVSVLRTTENPTPVPTTTKSSSGSSRTFAVLAAMMVAGVLIIGFAVWSTFIGQTDAPVETEVASAVEDNNGLSVDGVGDASRDVPDDSVASEAAVEQSIEDPADEEETASAQPADFVSSAATPASTLGEGIGLSVFDVDPVNEGTRSFAIRVSNASEEEVPSVAGFGIEIEVATGERVPAIVRFIHQEIPSGSSAIATVRVEDVPQGPATAVLVFGGDDVDAHPLP